MAMEIFSEYVEHLLKYINHTAFLQEWKLNIDATEYENNMATNICKPSEKKRFNSIDDHKHWPASIK